MDLTGLTEKVSEGRWKTSYYESQNGEIVAKMCRECREVKVLREFNNMKKGLAGKNSKCRKCNSIIRRKYREENREKEKERSRRYYRQTRNARLEYARKYREENREMRVEYLRKYYEETRNHRLEYARKYYRESREERRKYLRKYREENRDQLLEYRRKYYKENIDKLRKYREENRALYAVHDKKRRARKNALPYTLTEEEHSNIYKHFASGCALTGDSEIHMDHVIPLSSGHGGTIYENLIPLRADLNISKNDRCIFDWFADNRERFGLEQRKFDDLIEYLAGINDMTVEEYEEYVRWCHDNPRSIDEIKAEKETEPAS